MNNSLLAQQNVDLELEQPVDLTIHLREKAVELERIVDAIEKVAVSREWEILKEKVFDGVVESLMKARNVEVEKKPLNGPMIHSLNGQLLWAKKYSNLDTLASIYKQELSGIRKQLDGK